MSIGVFSGPAGAQGPRLQGWWASTNPGGLPVAPPQSPDVPPDGLMVQAGPSGPSAYAALAYDLESGATADALTLQLAPGALPSAPPTLALCALKDASFSAQQGGPMSDAPAYDCNRTATATLDGSSFTFKVGALVSDGVLAVAVVPGDPSTRAVLAHPSESSLTVTTGSGSAVVGTTVPPASDTGSGTSPSGSGAAAPPALPGLTGAADIPAPADPAPVPPAQVATGAGQAPAVAAAPETTLTATTPAASTHSTGALRRVLLVLLVAVLASAAVAWAFVGTGPVPDEDPATA